MEPLLVLAGAIAFVVGACTHAWVKRGEHRQRTDAGPRCPHCGGGIEIGKRGGE